MASTALKLKGNMGGALSSLLSIGTPIWMARESFWRDVVGSPWQSELPLTVMGIEQQAGGETSVVLGWVKTFFPPPAEASLDCPKYSLPFSLSLCLTVL